MANKAPDLDLLSLLTEDESRDLSYKTRQREERKASNRAQRKAERVKKLEDLGLLDQPTSDWVAQETVTFWRKWHCLCGEVFSGPAYDCNPTYVRLEKMRVRQWSVHHRDFVPLTTPKPLKGSPSKYCRADYQVDVPHRIEILNTQLWSCIHCRTTAVTSRDMARPWTTKPANGEEFLDPESARPKPKVFVPTHGEIEDLKTSPKDLIAGYEELGISPDGDDVPQGGPYAFDSYGD